MRLRFLLLIPKTFCQFETAPHAAKVLNVNEISQQIRQLRERTARQPTASGYNYRNDKQIKIKKINHWIGLASVHRCGFFTGQLSREFLAKVANSKARKKTPRKQYFQFSMIEYLRLNKRKVFCVDWSVVLLPYHLLFMMELSAKTMSMIHRFDKKRIYFCFICIQLALR